MKKIIKFPNKKYDSENSDLKEMIRNMELSLERNNPLISNPRNKFRERNRLFNIYFAGLMSLFVLIFAGIIYSNINTYKNYGKDAKYIVTVYDNSLRNSDYEIYYADEIQKLRDGYRFYDRKTKRWEIVTNTRIDITER